MEEFIRMYGLNMPSTGELGPLKSSEEIKEIEDIEDIEEIEEIEEIKEIEEKKGINKTGHLIEIQSKNPQLAAGLLNPLLYWKRYDASRQALIKAQLIRIFNLANLSKNLYELIQSTLTDNASKKT